MERLTRKETVIARGAEIAACNPENSDCDDGCRYGVCRWQEKANIRLKKYEDTDLTPEEIMELKERDTAKKIVDYEDDVPECPHCGSLHVYYYEEDMKYDYCPECGQRLKWED